MKLKGIIRIVALFAALIMVRVSWAQIDPTCTNCPPCTNCDSPTIPLPEYPLNTLLVRVASIMASDGTLLYTNYGWAADSNNLLMFAGSASYDRSTASSLANLVYLLAVTNTSFSRVYVIQAAPDVTGPYTNIGSFFYGATNNSECLIRVTVPSDFGLQWWRVKQQDGFVLYAMASTNGFTGGVAGSCPGRYNGYINWIRDVTNGWGYQIDTNYTLQSITDLNEPTNDLQLVTVYGYSNCNTNTAQLSVGVNTNTFGNVARATVYFKNYPTNQVYPLWWRGFVEPNNDNQIPAPRTAGAQVKPTLQVQKFMPLDAIQLKAAGLSKDRD